MRLSVVDYAEQTKAVVETERQRDEANQQQLEEIANMPAFHHLQLIKTIIQGHVGAKYIKIWYGVNSSVVTQEVALELSYENWYVDEIHDGGGIKICNFDYLENSSKCEYDEYPYRNFKVMNRKTTKVDFWFDMQMPNFGEQIENLLALKDKIRVQLWDLVIPKERICRPS